MSVFEAYRESHAWPFQFAGTLAVERIVGGVPSDPKVAEGWIRSKMTNVDERLQEAIALTALERGVTPDEAVEIVNTMKNLNGFKRDPKTGQLIIEGRQLKAAIKEAASTAMAVGKLDTRGYGATNKGLLSFLAEHVHVVENYLPLWHNGFDGDMDLSGMTTAELSTSPVMEPTGIEQRFVHTFRGSSIQYEEYVDAIFINFTVRADYDFDLVKPGKKNDGWPGIWTSGEMQGIGASRSQSYGRYQVVRWAPITVAGSTGTVKKKTAKSKAEVEA